VAAILGKTGRDDAHGIAQGGSKHFSGTLRATPSLCGGSKELSADSAIIAANRGPPRQLRTIGKVTLYLSGDSNGDQLLDGDDLHLICDNFGATGDDHPPTQVTWYDFDLRINRRNHGITSMRCKQTAVEVFSK
jgi:hypothetical protein